MEFPDIDLESRLILDIYARVIDPTNQCIDWSGFFIWANIKDVPNIEETADLMLVIRETLADLREDKENKMQNIEQQNTLSRELLSKKFGDL